MSSDLVELVDDHLKGPVAARVDALLDGTSVESRSLARASVAALLDGLVRTTATPGGAETVYAVVQAQDSALLDARPESDATEALAATGDTELGSLFGEGGRDAFGSALADFAGIDEERALALLAVLTPVTIGVVKHKVMSGGLNAAGLATLLHEQRPDVGAALPDELRAGLVERGFIGRLEPLSRAEADFAAGDAASGSDSSARRPDAGTTGVGGQTEAAARASSGLSGSAAAARAAGTTKNANSASSRAVDVDSAGTDADRGGRSGNPHDNSWSGWTMWKKLLPIIGILLLGWIVLNLFNRGDDPDTVAGVEAEAPDVVTAIDGDAAGEVDADAADATGETVADAADATGDAAADAADATEETVADAADATGEAMTDASDAVAEAGDGAAAVANDMAADALMDAEQAGTDAATDAADAAEGAVDATGDAATDSADATEETVADAADATGDAATDAADATGDAMTDVADATEETETVADAADATGDAAADAADATEETAEDAGTGIAALAGGAVAAAGDAVDAVQEAAVDAGEAIAETAGDVVDAAGEMASDAGDAISGTAEDAMDATGEAADEAGEAMSDTAGDAVDAADEMTDETGDAVSETTDEAAEAIDAGEAEPGEGAEAVATAITDDEAAIDAASGEGDDAMAGSDEATAGEEAPTTATASAGAFDLGGISRRFGGVFGSTSAILNGVTDAESAEKAAPRLERTSADLDEIAALYEEAPESARGPLKRVIDSGIARVQPLADSVLTRDGVGPVLGPIVEPMMETLQGLSN